eukprot:scaffold124583_cov30-Tisochrysis_lutea.AAC.7
MKLMYEARRGRPQLEDQVARSAAPMGDRPSSSTTSLNLAAKAALQEHARKAQQAAAEAQAEAEEKKLLRQVRLLPAQHDLATQGPCMLVAMSVRLKAAEAICVQLMRSALVVVSFRARGRLVAHRWHAA